MAPQVAAAYVAGSAALLGALIAGLIAVLTQMISQSAESRRRKLEAEERSRTRFHESRLRVYADFLDSASKTSRLALKLAVSRRTSLSIVCFQTVDASGLEGHSQQETHRLHREVLLLTRSTEVEQSAKLLMDHSWLATAIPPDATNFEDRMAKDAVQLENSRQKFIAAARKELDG